MANAIAANASIKNALTKCTRREEIDMDEYINQLDDWD